MPKTPDLYPSSFDYFSALFNESVQNTVLLMDKTGSITAVNRAFTNCFGYLPKDIIGKNIKILFTEEDQAKGKPEKELENVLAKGQADDNNYLVSLNKTITWVSGESILLKNDQDVVSILKVIQNIHQQKLSEESLERLNKFNENILESIEDVVIVIDGALNIIKANRAFAESFDFNLSGSVKINLADIISKCDPKGELENNIECVIRLQKTPAHIALEIETKSGENKMFDVSCSPVMQPGGLNHVLLVMHDITVFKQAEREREDLIGFVAHELRNPLANLVLCNDIMGSAIKENKQKELIDMLERSKNNVQRLNKMIAELYNATRVNSGNLNLDISIFNFGEMIKEAIDTIEVLQPSYNIVVKGDGNIEIRGDRYRLIQVVTNYLSNGIKYSNGKTDVLLSIQYDNKIITVSVKDEGLGISAHQLPHLFERFFRAEKTRNLEGIGLGLYLCRQIIHAHNGRVWAESAEGKGSTFYFSR